MATVMATKVLPMSCRRTPHAIQNYVQISIIQLAISLSALFRASPNTSSASLRPLRISTIAGKFNHRLRPLLHQLIRIPEVKDHHNNQHQRAIKNINRPFVRKQITNRNMFLADIIAEVAYSICNIVLHGTSELSPDAFKCFENFM
jgi:hypothetical protein